jgi:hypothetical protein
MAPQSPKDLASTLSTEQRWRERIAAWHRSGLTAHAFTADKPYATSTLRWWSSRLRRAVPMPSSRSGLAPPRPIRRTRHPCLLVGVGATRVRVTPRGVLPGDASFDMGVSNFVEGQSWWPVFWSPTIAPLYLSITWGSGLVAATWSFPQRTGRTCTCGLPLCPLNPWWLLVTLLVLLVPLGVHMGLVPWLAKTRPAAPHA